MGKDESRSQESAINTKIDEYVVVCQVQDEDQANEYQAILDSEDIPVLIQSSEEEYNFSLTVPEEYVDEAQSIIESQTAYNSFSDYDIDDEEADFDDTMFDEEY